MTWKAPALSKSPGGKDSATDSDCGVKGILLESYRPEVTMMLVVAGKRCHMELRQAPVGESQHWFMGFWNKAMASSMENYMAFEKLFLTC